MSMRWDGSRDGIEAICKWANEVDDVDGEPFVTYEFTGSADVLRVLVATDDDGLPDRAKGRVGGTRCVRMSDLRDDLHDAVRAAWGAGELPPELLVPDEYLWNCLHHAAVYPNAHLNLQHIEGHACETVNNRVCFTGSILREGDAFYRIDEYEGISNSWWARWPD